VGSQESTQLTVCPRRIGEEGSGSSEYVISVKLALVGTEETPKSMLQC
jgi:hypothetical protein